MKTFEFDNYYDILQLPPNAGKEDIRHAYQQTSALYDAESPATYALFSERQRKTLLNAIEKAFETLIDDDQRAAYDRMLLDTGALDARDFSDSSPNEENQRKDNGGPTREESLVQWTAKQAETQGMRKRIEAILSESRLSGSQLKELRNAYGIELSEIYAATRISQNVMTAIEEDRFANLPATVYLKQFLKNIAQILQIDPSHVVRGYLESMGVSQSGG